MKKKKNFQLSVKIYANTNPTPKFLTPSDPHMQRSTNQPGRSRPTWGWWGRPPRRPRWRDRCRAGGEHSGAKRDCDWDLSAKKCGGNSGNSGVGKGRGWQMLLNLRALPFCTNEWCWHHQPLGGSTRPRGRCHTGRRPPRTCRPQPPAGRKGAHFMRWHKAFVKMQCSFVAHPTPFCISLKQPLGAQAWEILAEGGVRSAQPAGRPYRPKSLGACSLSTVRHQCRGLALK